ncbi:putative mitochondrial protein [Cucumis melo var. makuwa]|uniref:Mitochondrial protein n=1 Tax=Cucumis melo var. makuwa TaxID=1194695 RepID=A0A5A7UNP5_CUCMM|nr:putative mitochondrial protein [Cucumis melo var. makuwa]
MEKSEIARPISTILDGSNYITWANQMKSFLIGRKLWRIVTGDIAKLTKQDKEDDGKFIERLEEWDNKNHQIITWLSNTSIPAIHTQFDAFESAKELWDFLSTRFKSVELAHYYQLHNNLVNLNQEAGQSVNEYLAVLQPIWTQLDQANISKDHLRLIKVLMGLRPEYESVRAALLHRSPLPSLDAAIQEILFEEKRLGINLSNYSDVVLASTYSPPGASSTFCKNCKLTGHKFIDCPKIECKYCHKPGHILDNCPIKPLRPRSYSTRPKNFTKPGTNPLWQKAMNDELQALEKTHTWDYVDLPPGKRPIGCKWIYKIKTHSDGTIERYKARLVAKGYSQEYGIDYEETFAPVARMMSVRSLLAVAAAKQWPLLQIDVKNAFLNGTLSEEVYMKPPPGTSSPPHKVCLLRRALYGLKQAPRAWFATFSSTITQLGFTSSPHDTALFTRHTPQGIVLLLLYVDDMIITGNDPQAISDLQHYLGQHFEMKDLGSLNYFLGFEVSRRSDGYLLSQAKYASDLLARSGITNSNTASTPLDPNVHLTPYDGVPLEEVSLYRQLVGSLIYLTVTRPDIAYVVHIVSQFMAAPRTIHFTAVLRILRYIKGTLGHGLQFSSQSSLVLSGYSDADWVGDPTDRRSTTGYCFYLGDSLISWRSKKQSVVSRSSTESEYRALADTTAELLWLRWLLADMGVPQQGPTLLYCDNRSAIQIAHNDVFHERTKHIENDCHFIRHHLLSNTLLLQPVSTTEQPADIFTKALPSTRFNQLRTKLKLTATLPP